ncbi:FKBP-type peptidyl-prolyl cis-trans isomerase [Parafrankia sp. EUN1f]|uniref:FKBP-type peptidyl-prolyl cis-trans isomerase n=1 Tax=Parafrankia sp. EUN1f TaxID=102897 RepID=UPI0001C449FE|nr:FKBP-type peptidyl-prolyl cis-trans isomerase [Parafrankia sp. EUN1f]EFC85261.1 peptidylprolyl isomerase FKBP-type [Parafrankia sp. EUN1f]
MTVFSRDVAARHRRRLIGLVLPAVLLVPMAACSSSDAPDGTKAAPVAAPSAAATAVGGAPAVENATDLRRKPVAAAGAGEAPSELVTKDLVTGDGKVATDSSTVTIHYAGTIWKTGKQFDASWDRSTPETFPLQNTVTGFGQGIAGMKEGGRRLIVIPPDLGYGPMGGQPAAGIEADDTLVFIVDLLAVGSGDATGSGSGGAAGSTSGQL